MCGQDPVIGYGRMTVERRLSVYDARGRSDANSRYRAETEPGPRHNETVRSDLGFDTPVADRHRTRERCCTERQTCCDPAI